MEVNLYIFSFNYMKKFVIHGILGLLLVFFFDLGIGRVLEYYYFKQESGFQHRTTISMDETNADILVFGSSRANHHYNPDVFINSLNKTFYNTGRDGNFIFYQTAVLKSILRRYKPKLILYDFSGKFSYVQEDYDRLSSLLPYYRKHREIRDIVNLRSSFEPLKNLSSIYPYNSTLANIVIGNSNLGKKGKKGYVSLMGEWNEPLNEHKSIDKYEVDENKLAIFNEFLDLCKQNDIPLLVFVSPVFYTYDKDYSITLCKQICNEKNIPFYDFTKDERFLKSPQLFDDKEHLNDSGAKLYSKITLNIIRQQLNMSNLD